MPLSKKEKYKIYAVLISAIGTGAFAIAFLIRQRVDLQTFGVSVLIFIALMSVYILVSKIHSSLVLHKAAIGAKKDEELNRIVASLSIEEAKDKALKLLSDSTHYQCIRKPTISFDCKDDLAAELQDVFLEFEYISAGNGGWFFDRRRIAVSAQLPSHYVIGFSVGDCELVVQPKSEVLYEVDICVSPAQIISSYPSLYHWIIVDAYLLYGIDIIKGSRST